MMSNFTPSDFIRFAYGEMDSFEIAEMQASLEADPVLQQELDSVLEAQAMLNATKYKPTATSIRIIMDHSRKQAAPELELAV